MTMESPDTVEIKDIWIKAKSLAVFKTKMGKRILKMPYYYFSETKTYLFDFIHPDTNVTWLTENIKSGTIYIRDVDHNNYLERIKN